MNSTTVVYGDPNNISIFESSEPYTIKNGTKILSTESYARELATVYEDFFDGIDSTSKFSLSAGENVVGKIHSINATELTLDVGQREFAYVSIDKDKLDVENFSVGQEVEAVIVEDQERSQWLKASITERIKKDIYDDMRDMESTKVYDAKVLCLSNNGYDLDISGLKVFMPGSLGGINKLVDFNSLVGKTIKVMTVKNNNSYSKYKNTLIVSHREYLKPLIPIEANKLEVGERYSGHVTDTTKFGIFVELEGGILTGLIHKDEFDEQLKDLFDANQVTPGVEIEFYLKEVVTPTRIILSRNPIQKEDLIKIEYKKNQEIEGKVTKLTRYGAFVKFRNDKNVSGLVHISKMKDIEVERGENVNCRIININNGKYDLEFIK